MLAPHVLEQDRRAGLELAGAHAAEQHLLVEGDDEIGLVAAVGHALRADADADAGRAGDAARRRLDLGRDDLDGPDAVADARGDRAERLAAALRAFARVADDLDDVLGQGLGALGAARSPDLAVSVEQCGVGHGSALCVTNGREVGQASADPREAVLAARDAERVVPAGSAS